MLIQKMHPYTLQFLSMVQLIMSIDILMNSLGQFVFLVLQNEEMYIWNRKSSHLSPVAQLQFFTMDKSKKGGLKSTETIGVIAFSNSVKSTNLN